MLNDDVLLCIKSFVMKPRHFYAHIHGKKLKHAAFELCLFLLTNHASEIMLGKISKMKKIGVRFPRDHNLIYQKFWTTFEIKDDFGSYPLKQLEGPYWATVRNSFKAIVFAVHGKDIYLMKKTDSF